MIVRMEGGVFALAITEVFEGTVGNDLVGVHVGRCACATLDHLDDELVMQLSGDDLVAGMGNCLFICIAQNSELPIGLIGARLTWVSRAHDQQERRFLARAALDAPEQ